MQRRYEELAERLIATAARLREIKPNAKEIERWHMSRDAACIDDGLDCTVLNRKKDVPT